MTQKRSADASGLGWNKVPNTVQVGFGLTINSERPRKRERRNEDEPRYQTNHSTEGGGGMKGSKARRREAWGMENENEYYYILRDRKLEAHVSKVSSLGVIRSLAASLGEYKDQLHVEGFGYLVDAKGALGGKAEGVEEAGGISRGLSKFPLHHSKN